MSRHHAPPPSCPRCQAPIPPAAPGAVCPACLLSQVLAAPEEASGPTGRPGAPDATVAGRNAFPRRFGPYRLLSRLGRGGMGEVFEAEHRATGRRVALKRLAVPLDSPEMRRRFLREGRLAACVDHPNSLYVFGSEEIDGDPVITMEIAAGGTLQDEIEEHGPLAPGRAVDAILDVIAGLEAAREAGVLHCDVKPSNCFRSADGSVKVGDYGLSVSSVAREDSLIASTHRPLGTPAYASPEQLRGDPLDGRADLYSVGATLHALLTGRPPFEGRDAVQIVASAVERRPPAPDTIQAGVPAALGRIVVRCLAKDPAERYRDFAALRRALLPFRSAASEPAPMAVRAAAGWIDFLLAFFVPYALLALTVGSAAFHFAWLVEPGWSTAKPYLAFLASGVLYFTLTEGLWGGGLGKRSKGLVVQRRDGSRPGVMRGALRILLPLASIEVVRLPLLFAVVDATRLDAVSGREILLHALLTTLTPGVPALLSLTARRSNGFATVWDLSSGTRVVFEPASARRPTVPPLPDPVGSGEEAWLGPYRVVGEIEPDRWLSATDPALRRSVWLIRREESARRPGHEPGPSPERRAVARPGRPRWLQEVRSGDGDWDAYEATPGSPLRRLTAEGRRLPWTVLRHWLHDLAAELWVAAGEGTLPERLSLDQVWITSGGRAVLLDRPRPDAVPAEPSADFLPTADLAGRLSFLRAVASRVETTSLPTHALPVWTNLVEGRFERLSFLAGSLRGLLERPAEPTSGQRAGALFLLPVYIYLVTLVGLHGNSADLAASVAETFGSLPFFVGCLVLACAGLAQLVVIPWRTTAGHSLFRLALVDATGRPASRRRLLARWAVAWLPLVGVLGWTAWAGGGLAGPWPRVWLALWLGAALQAALDPRRGLHDRLAGTWVVRR